MDNNKVWIKEGRGGKPFAVNPKLAEIFLNKKNTKFVRTDAPVRETIDSLMEKLKEKDATINQLKARVEELEKQTEKLSDKASAPKK